MTLHNSRINSDINVSSFRFAGNCEGAAVRPQTLQSLRQSDHPRRQAAETIIQTLDEKYRKTIS